MDLRADRDDRPVRRTGGRSARVRTAVLEAAFGLALEQGLSITVADVAERAGVHPTSIYRRWGGRERLLVEALLSQIGELAPMPDTGSLEGVLRAFLSASAQFISSPQGMMLARMAVATHDSRELRDLRTEYWGQALANAAKIFERALARGEMTPGITPTSAVELVTGPLYMRTLLTGEALDDTFVDAIVRTTLAGLAPGRPQERRDRPWPSST